MEQPKDNDMELQLVEVEAEKTEDDWFTIYSILDKKLDLILEKIKFRKAKTGT